jgi:hypothetical protein
MSKYHNKKITVDGITFDSKKEYSRYRELLLLERAGEISNLRRQVKFVLIPAQYEKTPERYTKGEHKGELKQGKLLERECAYVADFVYIDSNGKKVVEDTKSKATKTKDYIIKRKLMLYRFGIKIHEV